MVYNDMPNPRPYQPDNCPCNLNQPIKGNNTKNNNSTRLHSFALAVLSVTNHRKLFSRFTNKKPIPKRRKQNAVGNLIEIN